MLSLGLGKMVQMLLTVNGIDAVVVTGAFLKHAAFPAVNITNEVAVTPQSGYLRLSNFTKDGYEHGVLITFVPK